MIGIYQILNCKNNKRYIGSSINILKRLTEHRYILKIGKHHSKHLQNAYDKYTKDSFEFKPILECSEDQLVFYENLIIKGYKSNSRNFGYNIREASESNKGLTSSRTKHRSGDKYNRLTLIKPLHLRGDARIWLVKCDCGKEIEVSAGDVRHNHTKSCGCLNLEKRKERITNYNNFRMLGT